VNDDEFLAVVEKCREQRAALDIAREAGGLLERPPHEFGWLVKVLQDWSSPASIDRAVRPALDALGREQADHPEAVRAKELLSAMLLATGQRAARAAALEGHERVGKATSYVTRRV
jgi:hypothetical protein